MAVDATRDRALAAFVGGALGDALGMPTQLMSAQEIRQTYGFVDRFLTPSDDHPVSRGLAAGMITDDTEQTLLLARILLMSQDAFDHMRWVEALVEWEADVKARGSYDLLGPSTKRAIDAIRAGTPPEEAGRGGDTNGAAMRIAPVGILMPLAGMQALVDKVAETCLATHNSPVAVASASAVAAAISAGVEGSSWRDAIGHAIDAATLAAHKDPDGGTDIAALIARAVEMVRARPREAAIDLIADEIGTSVASRESIPAAFAVLAVAEGDPWQAAIIGANIGGDTDTIGAIAGSMAGACAGLSAIPHDHVALLRGFDHEEANLLATRLVAARRARSGGKRAA